MLGALGIFPVPGVSYVRLTHSLTHSSRWLIGPVSGGQIPNKRAMRLGSATLALGLTASWAIPVAVCGQQPSPDARGTSVAPAPASDSSGTLTGTLIGRDDGQVVQYGTVLLVGSGEALFTDADGRFRINRLIPGTYRIRARQIGYAPADTSVRVDAVPAVTTATIHLVRLPPRLGVVKVEGHRSGDCVVTGVPDSAVDPGLAANFAQVRENVDRFVLLMDQYPFRYTGEERIVRRLEPGGDSTLFADTITYESRGQRRYRVGAVVYDAPGPQGPRRVMYLPTFRDLADSTFLAAHCFSFGGEQLEPKSKERVLRLDFRPGSAISTPDVEGSVFLDAERLIVRRAVFRLTKPESLDPPVLQLTVTSMYRELLPFVPVLDESRTVQPFPPDDPTRRVVTNRTIITTDRILRYQFETVAPGDQPAAISPHHSAPAMPDRAVQSHPETPDARTPNTDLRPDA